MAKPAANFIDTGAVRLDNAVKAIELIGKLSASTYAADRTPERVAYFEQTLRQAVDAAVSQLKAGRRQVLKSSTAEVLAGLK